VDSGTFITWLWLGAGIVLVGSEVFHASLTTVFLGLAAMGVAGLRAMGLIEALPTSFVVWAVLTVALTVPLRPLVRRWLPGDSRKDMSDEDKDAMGTLVDVLDDIVELEPVGRIRFQGTSWPALTAEGSIPRGAKARLVYRDKLAWVVERVPELEEASVVPRDDLAILKKEDR
jgi:membrane protein implicated in regulation of membrane protease activity